MTSTKSGRASRRPGGSDSATQRHAGTGADELRHTIPSRNRPHSLLRFAGKRSRQTVDERRGSCSGESLQFANRQRCLHCGCSEAPRELRARADTELAVDAGERRLDGLRGDVEARSDLGIPQPWPASSATRSSVGVSASLVPRRPPRRRSSASTAATRAGCGSQRRSISPRPASQLRRDDDRARRRIPPATRSVRPRSSGQSRRSCSASARCDSREGLVGLAARGGDESRRPRSGRKPPGAVEAPAVLLELGRQLDCLVDLTEADERLDRVRVERMHRPLAETRRRAACPEAGRAPHALRRGCPPRARGDRAPRGGGQPDRRRDRREYSIPALRMRRASSTRPRCIATAPLGYHSALEVAAELAIEVDELGGICLSLREVAGAHFELDEMENAPGGRADALELDRQLELLAAAPRARVS